MSGEETSNHAEHHEKVGRLEADIRTLTKAVEKLFNKFDEFVIASAPKQMGIPAMLGLLATLLGILALMFGSVIYIANSSNAPLVAQMNQMVSVVQTMQTQFMQNQGAIQLVNKDTSVINNKATGNEETLRWLLFTENIPKQITELNGRIDLLTYQINKGNSNGIPKD